MGEKMWPDQGSDNASRDGSSTEEKQAKKESALDKMYNNLFPDMKPSRPILTIKTPVNPDLRFRPEPPKSEPVRDLRFRPEPPKSEPVRDLRFRPEPPKK